MSAVIIRILLRYLAAFLVAKGVMSEDFSNLFGNDPDIAAAVEIAIGALVAIVAEFWYFVARRFGWST